MSKQTKWAIIGGGNGGQSLAGHLAIMGFPVRLFDIFPATVEVINEQGGIHVDGVVQGFGKLEFATVDIGKAIQGADVVMVVAPATAHRTIARDCAPYLVDGQIVMLHPGATCGALEFKEVLRQAGSKAKVPIAETNSLIYACRSPKPGYVDILGIKDDLVMATLPAKDNAKALQMINEAFPQVKGGKNVLETSLGNANAIMHPTPSILNLSMIESKHDWLYYLDGITPTIGAFVEELDKERVALAKSFGLSVPTIADWYRISYSVAGRTLSELCKKNPAYAKIKGQKDFKTRYVLEDIPTGLVPMIELGKMQGLSMERMELIARLGQYLLQDDALINGGRTLKNLGLADMTQNQFAGFLETGER